MIGCEHVQEPLVCNLTDAFFNTNKTYHARVTAKLGTQESEAATTEEFKPVRDSKKPFSGTELNMPPTD